MFDEQAAKARLAQFARQDRIAMEVDLSSVTQEELMAHYQIACDTNNELYVARVVEELKNRFNTVIWPPYKKRSW